MSRRYVAEIEGRVCGIPCIIAVTHYDDYVPAYTSGPVESCHPSEGGTGDYDILDRRGRRAQWLERKITAAEDSRIQEQIFDYMEG